MRMSQLFLRTLRDDPADAEIDSHKLLVRTGAIRRISSGIYSWLPLGNRVLRNVEQIVREEMDAAGAQEVILPNVQPLELWERTGRDVAYGPQMFKLKDRRETGFALAPTAEEVVTSIVASEYSSYRDLPVNLYQINWKYRDELRPRFGLLRSREFLMKDAYSFHVDVEDLRKTYAAMYEAYERIFARCGLTVRAVEAQAGEIGGDINHEFMAVAPVGEDDFVWCRSCDYAANVEAAVRSALVAPGSAVDASIAAPEAVPTPGMGSISDVAAHLGVPENTLLKSIAFDVGGKLALAVVPGDREVNEFAFKRAVAPLAARLYTDEDFARNPAIPKGFIGPDHSEVSIVVADPSVHGGQGWVIGANRVDEHTRNAVPMRDFRIDVVADLVIVASGDSCARCGGELSVDRGIEVGHVFQLGTKYSTALDATYTDDAGAQHPMVMGCYGVGVSRIVAAVVEEHSDENGITWPEGLAPYDVQLMVLAGTGDAGAGVKDAAERLYRDLQAAGVSVLFDDRDASPGVKFADADLLGMPVQIVLGAKGLARGVAERKIRATGERDEIAIDEVVTTLSGR